MECFVDLSCLKALKAFIKRDYEKINGRFTGLKCIKSYLFEPGFKFVCWLRITRYFHLKPKFPFILGFAISRLFLKHYAYKFGFDVSYRRPIGPGLSIAHFGSVVLAAKSVGKDCYLRPGVVVGKNLLKDGLAVIGNNVHFGVGCKVVGSVTIGDNVVIGANAVVTHDIPSNCVAAGVPARIIKRLETTAY